MLHAAADASVERRVHNRYVGDPHVEWLAVAQHVEKTEQHAAQHVGRWSDRRRKQDTWQVAHHLVGYAECLESACMAR